jgi:hypothetical protein
MKRLMTHQAIFDMNQAFKRAKFSGKISSLFRYAMHKNIETTQKEVDSMIDAFPPDEEYCKYRTDLREIAKAYGIDHIDNPREFDLKLKALSPDQGAEFTKQQTDLADKYKDAIERQRAIDAELDAFLKEKIEIDLSMVTADTCPEISGDEGALIYDHMFPMFIPVKENETIKDIVSYEYK